MSNQPFGFDKPEDSPGFLLWQTTITWQRMIKKALDKYNISHAQFVILAIVLWFTKHKTMPTQVLIIKQSKLDKMTVSKALKKLSDDGFVKRAEHGLDTRAKSVELTTRGKTIVALLVPVVENIDQIFFSCLAIKEQKSFIQTLNKLVSK